MQTTVNQRIKMLRENLGHSQREFAEKIGVVQKTIWQIENEETTPSYKVLTGLVEVYQVRSEWLIEGIGAMFKTASLPLVPPAYPLQEGSELMYVHDNTPTAYVLQKYIRELETLLERMRKEAANQ